MNNTKNCVQNRKIRVLYLTAVPIKGGPGGGIATWTNAILNSKLKDMLEIDAVNTGPIGKRLKQLYGKRSFFEELRRFVGILRDTKKKKKQFRPDIVHINSSCSPSGMIREIICARIARKEQVIIQFHCDIPYQVNSRVSRVLLKSLIRNVDEVLTLNRSSSSYLTDICGIESRIIPNFLPNETLKRLCTKRKMADKVSTVIFVGHITKAKGCDIILELAKLNSCIEFRLLGHISPEFKDIELPRNMSLLGEGDERKVFEELEKSDVFLFPSRSEGFPIALLEAMACGLPVIASTVGAIPDMLEGKGGITTEGVGIDNFNVALKSILESKEERKRMSEWNREKAINEFSEDKVLEKLFEIYNEMVKI